MILIHAGQFIPPISFCGKSCQPFNSDAKVRIEFPDHTRFYYPDAMVVCQSNPDSNHFQNQPVVIIEVLSDSNRRADLGEKRDAYLMVLTRGGKNQLRKIFATGRDIPKRWSASSQKKSQPPPVG